MVIETIFDRLLLLATILCSLNAGLLFAFAVIIMPGLKQLEDGEFIRAFQKIDGIIQNKQPLFVLVWAGSAAALLIITFLGSERLENWQNIFLFWACVAYFIGVQLPTFSINIPLNNRLQSVDVDALDNSALKQERIHFEPRWIFWNTSRTIVAVGVSIILVILVQQL